MNHAEKIAAYVKIRDYKKAAKKEFDESMKKVNDAMLKLENELLAALTTDEVDSIKADTGTAYRIVRSNCSVKDREEFFRWAVTNRLLEALDIKANKKVVKELLDKGVDVPGINYTEAAQIGVRRGNDE